MMTPLYLTRSLKVPSLPPFKEPSHTSTERKRKRKEMSSGSLIPLKRSIKVVRRRKMKIRPVG
jgi:hypothetical protein